VHAHFTNSAPRALKAHQLWSACSALKLSLRHNKGQHESQFLDARDTSNNTNPSERLELPIREANFSCVIIGETFDKPPVNKY